jgi:hypothetical protein
LANKRQFSLHELFKTEAYPTDIPRFYAQSHSISGFLVDAKGHQTFLMFLKTGIERGWDQAASAQYGYQNVEEMENAWLVSVRRDMKTAE